MTGLRELTDDGFLLPEDVGLPLGSDGICLLKLEIHYDNPGLDVGVADNSTGMRLYWTTEKREFGVGVAQLGDPFVKLRGTPVGDGLSRHHLIAQALARTF